MSSAVYALGLGNINVTSSLGEPLKANIGLVAAGKNSDGLSARLASPETFKNANIDYPTSLPKLTFSVETRANGEPYIHVSTEQPVNEPFISILVELNAPSGKLLREYTFLLDPPGFRPGAANSATPNKVDVVEPVVTTEQSPATSDTTASPPPVAPQITSLPPTPPPASSTTASSASGKGASSGNSGASGKVEVKRGDTLSSIAEGMRPDGISLERMLIATYRANARSFGGNMNNLRAGRILRAPTQEEIAAVSEKEAVQSIHAQTADWNAYKQKLASAATPSSQTEGGRETSGKISATVADKAPQTQEGSKEVVRLSKGEAPGDKAGGSAQAQINALKEEAIAREKQLKDSNDRVAMLEKNISEMQRLLAMKNQGATPTAPQATPATPASAPQAAPSIAVPPLSVFLKLTIWPFLSVTV
ncbi:MAG: hypothetical protein LBG66_00295, partial [Gallionellaceae bacterium]|nr:hypothetical protein [Gallionellaceae bacterium]